MNESYSPFLNSVQCFRTSSSLNTYLIVSRTLMPRDTGLLWHVESRYGKFNRNSRLAPPFPFQQCLRPRQIGHQRLSKAQAYSDLFGILGKSARVVSMTRCRECLALKCYRVWQAVHQKLQAAEIFTIEKWHTIKLNQRGIFLCYTMIYMW